MKVADNLVLDGHIKDITSTSGVEFDTETIFASTILVRGIKLILQIYPEGLSIIDIGSQGIWQKIFLYCCSHANI